MRVVEALGADWCGAQLGFRRARSAADVVALLLAEVVRAQHLVAQPWDSPAAQGKAVPRMGLLAFDMSDAFCRVSGEVAAAAAAARGVPAYLCGLLADLCRGRSFVDVASAPWRSIHSRMTNQNRRR